VAENLFSARSLAIGGDLQRVVRERVGALPEDALLNLPVPVVIDEVVSDLAATQIDLRWHDIYSSGVQETTVGVRGFDDTYPDVRAPAGRMVFRVPFDGDPDLFDVRPTSFTLNPPSARVDPGARELVITMIAQQLTEAAVRAHVDGQQQAISQYVGWVNADVRAQRDEIERLASIEVASRRERLLQARGVEASLGIPIRPAGASTTYPVPVRRARLRLTETAARETFSPEPILELSIYEDILRLIANFRATLERSPGTFARLSEEELRDHLILILNGSYSGAATAETFNGKGKTDILLRHNDRNVFIAECKFWHGAKAFTSAIDQLLGYLVWRDSKAALIVFIRNKNVSQVIQNAVETLQGHPLYVSGGAGSDPSDRSDFILRASEEDTTRTIRVALIPIVVPATAT
jgi:hypothetical protein